MSQGQYQLTIVTDDSSEVRVSFISHYLDERCVNQTVQCIDHRNVRQTRAVATQEATAFVVVVLTSKRHMRQVCRLELHSEIVDGLCLKINK